MHSEKERERETDARRTVDRPRKKEIQGKDVPKCIVSHTHTHTH